MTEQEVAIKVDTFPFQRHGTLKGRLVQISADSTDHELYGPSYTAIVETPGDDPRVWSFSVEGERRRLEAGMTVTAEIIIGRRRIIMFFLSPIIKTLDESVSLR